MILDPCKKKENSACQIISLSPNSVLLHSFPDSVPLQLHISKSASHPSRFNSNVTLGSQLGSSVLGGNRLLNFLFTALTAFYSMFYLILHKSYFLY